MNRRNFMKLAGVSALSPYLLAQSSFSDLTDIFSEDDNYYLSLLKANDNLIPDLLAGQNLNQNLPDYGGLPDQLGIHTAGGSARLIEVLACAYLHPSSDFFNQQYY